MLCKRMALALLLPLSLAVMVGVGCGGTNEVEPPSPPPPLSSDAGITGFSISPIEMSPAVFSPSISRYSASAILGEESVGVTVTLNDAKAKLRVNGLEATSGVRTNFALVSGTNTITAVVTAEDGVASNTVTLTVNKLANTAVYVLNGVGGVPYDGTLLTITDADGKVLVKDVPLPKEDQGKKMFGLEPGKKYNLYAKAPGSAAGCFANFDPSKLDTALIYCYRTSSTYYEMEAPIITDVSFASATSQWKNMPNSESYVGPLSDVMGIKVTILTRNIVYPGAGPLNSFTHPIRINIDEEAAFNVGSANEGSGLDGTMVERNVAVKYNGKDYYKTTHSFANPCKELNFLSNKNHFMEIAAFDAIGNRTRQQVYLTITDSAATHISDPDLTGFVPQIGTAQAHSVAGGGDWNRVNPGGAEVNFVDPSPLGPQGYYEVIAGFYPRTSAGAGIGIRGYEMWRSIGDESNFVKVATFHFATLFTTTAQRSHYDCGPEIVVGDVYYKFRVFNGNPANGGYSQFSPSVKARVLPITYVRPAASHQTVSNKVWPEFRIAATNPTMMKKETSDRFHFTLFMKHADDPYPFLMIPFRVVFADTVAADKPPAGWPAGQPLTRYYQITSYTESQYTGTYTMGGSWYDAKDDVPDGVDGEGNPKTKMVPFVTVSADGSVVIDTSSPTFKKAMENRLRFYWANEGETFVPGTTYLWNLYGDRAGIGWNNPGYPVYWEDNPDTDAAYFAVGTNPGTTTGTAASFQGVSYGSHANYDYGSPEGWFTLIIDPDAK